MYNVVSSANKNECILTEYTSSLIQVRNKSGPQTEPCGTPKIEKINENYENKRKNRKINENLISKQKIKSNQLKKFEK